MTKRIQIQLVKLANGARLLRFSEKKSGLSLEKQIAARQPVVRQKQRLLREFEQLLERELSVRSA
jgi:hypothetical protein